MKLWKRTPDDTPTYYLFELGHSIVKKEGSFWYDRDRKNHLWKYDSSWMARYFDAQYEVIEIDYDEETEQITARRQIPGFGCSEELLHPKADE